MSDVVVSEGPIPGSLARISLIETEPRLGADRLIVDAGPEAGLLAVEHGRTITVQRAERASDERIAFHVAHTGLATILNQRGILVWHASAALTPAGIVIVAGDTGAGKSTTAAALAARGCAILADDAVAIAITADGVFAQPGATDIYIDAATAQSLGEKPETFHAWRRMKGPLTPKEVISGPLKVAALCALSRGGSELQMRPLTGAEKIATLQRCIHGPVVPSQHSRLFTELAAFASRVPVFSITRPQKTWSAQTIAALILEERWHAPDFRA